MMSAAPAEMDALSARLNSVLRLGSGWMVQCDAIRSRAPGYPEQGAFPDPVTRVIDDERRQQFMQEGAHYESEYFLTLTYLPPLEVEERMKGWMFEGGGPQSANRTAEQILDRFSSRVDVFENVFGQLFQTERLKRICVHRRLRLLARARPPLALSAALRERRGSSLRAAGDSVLPE